jgi:hypothetical protein
MNSEWPSLYGGQSYVWKPLPGLDPGLGEPAMWIGASIYAQLKAEKKPESLCQMEAEKAAFASHYRIRYFTESR